MAGQRLPIGCAVSRARRRGRPADRTDSGQLRADSSAAAANTDAHADVNAETTNTYAHADVNAETTNTYAHADALALLGLQNR